MENSIYRYRRAAIGLAAALAASFSFAGAAQAQFTGSGLYRISLPAYGEVLHVDNSWGRDQTEEMQLLRSLSYGSQNQQFMIFRNIDGTYQIRPRHSAQCLEARGGVSASVGAVIQQRRCNNGLYQRFYISVSDRSQLLYTIRSVPLGHLLYAPRSVGYLVQWNWSTPEPLEMLFQFVSL